MKHLKTIAFALVFVVSIINVFGQGRWSAEFRPNIDFTTKNIADTKLKTGFGFEVAISYMLIQHLNAYVGWGFKTFQSDDESRTDFDETGYAFGFQFVYPLSKDAKLSYLLRAGAIYNQIKIENINSNNVQDSGHGLGYEFGAGLDYNLGTSDWSLRPQFGYSALSRNIEISNTKTNIDLNSIVFTLGVSKKF